MAGEGNCTSGPKVDLTSHKRASTVSDSSQIRKEVEVGNMVVDCQAETRARPLCMRGKMTRDEVTFGNDFTLGFVAHNIKASSGYSFFSSGNSMFGNKVFHIQLFWDFHLLILRLDLSSKHLTS